MYLISGSGTGSSTPPRLPAAPNGSTWKKTIFLHVAPALRDGLLPTAVEWITDDRRPISETWTTSVEPKGGGRIELGLLESADLARIVPRLVTSFCNSAGRIYCCDPQGETILFRSLMEAAACEATTVFGDFSECLVQAASRILVRPIDSDAREEIRGMVAVTAMASRFGFGSNRPGESPRAARAMWKSWRAIHTRVDEMTCARADMSPEDFLVASGEGCRFTLGLASEDDIEHLASNADSLVRVGLTDWCLVALSGPDARREIHALGLLDGQVRWLTAPIVSVNPVIGSVRTRWGHSYMLSGAGGGVVGPEMQDYLKQLIGGAGYKIVGS